jgi:hypothetical protein
MHGIPHLQIKKKKKFQGSIKSMHYSTNYEEIKTEIEKLGERAQVSGTTNKLPLSMFFVELKPAPNNREIFHVQRVQNKILTAQRRKGYC